MVNMSSIQSKKYDILRASLNFPNQKDRDKLLASFKEVSLELEESKYQDYKELLPSYLYDTSTLEDEKERLEKLIFFINDYKEKFKELKREYYEITLSDLPVNDEYDDTYEYEKRLGYIKEYILNKDRINILYKTVSNLNSELHDLNNSNIENKRINESLEKELKDYFNSFIKNTEMFKTLDYSDIEFELEKVEYEIKEKKNELDNFYLAYASLENQVLPDNKILEYKSYVQEARLNYLTSKEKELIYKLYKLINNIEYDYNDLYTKRESIDLLLGQRLILRIQLEIDDIDIFKDLSALAENQFNIIKKQKSIIDYINDINKRIDESKEEINILKNKNETVEILSILNEYEIIDTYELDDNLDIQQELKEEIAPNEILEVEKNDKIDLNITKNTATEIMKEVIKELIPNEEKEETPVDIIDNNSQDDVVEKLDNSDIFAPVEEVLVEEENIFPDEIVTEPETEVQDDFFSKEEKLILNDELDNEPVVEDTKLNPKPGYPLSAIPDIDNIGSVKPTNYYSELENKTNSIKDIELPTNGILTKETNVFNSSEYLENKD